MKLTESNLNSGDKDHMFGILERMLQLQLLQVKKQCGVPYPMDVERAIIEEITRYLKQ